MSSPLRFALLGAGRIAQTYAQMFSGATDLVLAAVVDVNKAAAIELARQAGGSAWPDIDTLLAAERDRLDAAIVCTPPNTHHELTLALVQAGIPVLCEKPFSLDVPTARAMIRAARRARVQLTMASKFRYADDVLAARQLVQSGLLGEVILFENAFTSRVDMSERWNANPAISGGGVLIDNGTHSVDLMRYFLGPLAEVQAVEGKRVQDLRVEDTVHIFARSVSGVLGSIDLSWSINKEQESYLTIHGSLGTLHVGWRESKYRLHNQKDWVVFGRGYDKIQAFRSQVTNFARAIRGEEGLRITTEDALASVQVVRAAYRSLRRSQWIAVAMPLPLPGAKARKRRGSPAGTNGTH